MEVLIGDSPQLVPDQRNREVQGGQGKQGGQEKRKSKDVLRTNVEGLNTKLKRVLSDPPYT